MTRLSPAMRRALDLAAVTGRLVHDGNTGRWVPMRPRLDEIRKPRPHAKAATVHALLERGLLTDDRDRGYAWCNAARLTNHEDPMRTQTIQHRVLYAAFVGSRLKLARELAGLSLTQAAKLLDVSPDVLSILERDTAERGTPLPKAAAVYGVSARWLTEGTRNLSVSHVGALVLHVGWPAVASAAATLAGGTYTPVADEAPGGIVDALLSTMGSTGAVATEVQTAMADGALTESERVRILDAVDTALLQLQRLRAAVLR